ncbi:sulfatase [candidate division CSSED10-310 bacterium]|uniref:Sulfatase n=1 Tax=candidate division CSSED10-310 bacterium TaxID=2855610 RepID=A0ABV6Z085_UNCC1
MVRLTRRDFLYFFTLSSIGILSQGCSIGNKRVSRPNFIIFLGDDHSVFDVGCYGNKIVRTPNINRLAAEGMRFERAYTTTAMCAPSRSSLFTGLYPHRSGCHMNHGETNHGVKSITHYLHVHGYRVVLTGKRHIKPKSVFPFESVSYKARTLENIINSKEPFCFIIASREPHSPHRVGRYTPDQIPLPPYLVDTAATRENLARYYADIEVLDREVGQALRILEKSGKATSTIFIYTADHGQGILAKWSCYDAGLRVPFVVRWPGKINAGSVSQAMISFIDIVPTFIEAAGAIPPKNIDGQSFLAVLLGKQDSHRKLIFGTHTNRGIISGKAFPIRSVRNERYKYIRNLRHKGIFQCIETHGLDWKEKTHGWWIEWKEKAKSDAFAAERVQRVQHRPVEELYDLHDDPWELHNLINDPQFESIKKELSEKVDTWMKQQNDFGLKTEMAVKLFNSSK